MRRALVFAGECECTIVARDRQELPVSRGGAY